MIRILKKSARSFCILIVLNLLFLAACFAQAEETSFGIAKLVDIKGDVKDGSIISLSQNEYILSSKDYDPHMVGVVSQNPAVELTVEGIGKYAVISEGIVLVNVSKLNGSIKKGDLITTSSLPGVGMKSTEEGFVLGSALEDFSSTPIKSGSSDKNEIKKIPVSLNILYFSLVKPADQGAFFDISRLNKIALKEKPLEVLKYTLAALLVLSSFLLGFVSFGRAASQGIQALGRNPLSSRMIQLGILFNASITIVIMLVGLAMAYFILRL